MSVLQNINKFNNIITIYAKNFLIKIPRALFTKISDNKFLEKKVCDNNKKDEEINNK